ncbi:MAG: hypothetical protein U0872_16015, partial [Planctomycetaceae bacterium]
MRDSPSFAAISAASPPAQAIPPLVQLFAWLAGIRLCVYGLFEKIPAWSYAYALTLLLLLAVAPVCWRGRLRRQTGATTPPVEPTSRGRRIATAVLLAGCSWGVSDWTAQIIGDWPPAYHDEYSYLFQAKTFLAGRTWFPSHPTHPELFDQVHVLNDNGRMASRYFPGTGAWMAPFVAMNRPYWGHWICGMFATLCIYAAGCEIGNERTGLIAGLLTALSPGLALFSNLLLAHHPTLLGLSFFVWRMSRFERTLSWWDAVTASLGLSWAMLCRPMTAAGFGLPFGLWTAWWLIRGSAPILQRVNALLGFAVPIVVGLGIQLGYNASITGSPWTSPYQLYTDVYTPRHVYGFNNVVRGEQHLGPKVLDSYDRWAENLTPELAARNVGTRLYFSTLWTWDLLPLAMISVISLAWIWRFDRRVQLVFWAIVSLHAVHIPYWYAGIMGWHYVFETSILWTLLSAVICDRLWQDWRIAGRSLMPWWLAALGMVTLAGNFVTVPDLWIAKLAQEIPPIRYPRRMHGEFRGWVQGVVGEGPGLVLVAPHSQDRHLDYVV